MAGITREKFIDYIRAFNSRDVQRQHSYYHPEIDLRLPEVALHGSKEIIEHYDRLLANAEETVVPITLLSNEDNTKLFFEMHTYFHYTADNESGINDYALKKGDVVKLVVWAIYIVEGGKMRSITCNLFKSEILGQVDCNSAIRKSQAQADQGLIV